MADLIYGINPVREALQGVRRRPLELTLVAGARPPRLAELAVAAAAAGIPVRSRERRDLDRLAGTPHHQGAVLALEPFPFSDLDALLGAWRGSNRPAFLLLLDGITDPHNLGAILRSAESAGCHGVIVPKDRSCPVTAVVDKTSAGALEHLRLCQVTNLARTLEALKQEGIWCLRAGRRGRSHAAVRRRSGRRRRPGGRQRGGGAAPQREAALRRPAGDSHAGAGRFSERLGGDRDRPVRGGAAAGIGWLRRAKKVGCPRRERAPRMRCWLSYR